MSQREFVTSFNDFLVSDKNKHKNERGVKTVTYGTASRWENSLNHPTESMWQVLADFFDVSVEYLKGAYSKEEIAKIIQDEYKRQYDISNMDMYELSKAHQLAKAKLFYGTVDDYFISIGVIPYDIKKDSLLLSEKQINDFNFWCSNLDHLYKKISIKWLLNKPTLDANKEDVLSVVNDAMDSIINESSVSLFNPWPYRNNDGVLAEQYFAKRLEFINKHLFSENKTYEVNGHKYKEAKPYINWDETNEPKNK